jgi:hypothetical protein
LEPVTCISMVIGFPKEVHQACCFMHLCHASPHMLGENMACSHVMMPVSDASGNAMSPTWCVWDLEGTGG